MPALAAAVARAEGRGWTLRRSCPPYGDRRDRGGQRRGHRLGLCGAGAGAWRRSQGGRGSSAPRRGGTAESRPPAEQARRRRPPARGTAQPPPQRCGRPRADAAARGCASWGARAGVGVETPQLIVGEAVRPAGVVRGVLGVGELLRRQARPVQADGVGEEVGADLGHRRNGDVVDAQAPPRRQAHVRRGGDAEVGELLRLLHRQVGAGHRRREGEAGRARW